MPEDQTPPEDELDLGDEMESLGDDLEAAGREAVADLVEELAGAGDGILGAVEDAVLDKAWDLLGDDVEEIPSIIGSTKAKRGFDMGTRALTNALVEQGRVAIESLKLASVEAAEQGSEVLVQISEVGQMVASGQLRAEDGEIAVDHYMEALELIGKALKNTLQVEAYLRGRALLATTKSVVFSLLKMGLQIGAGKAGAWMGGMVLAPE